MTYDEALSALQGMLGSQVSVTISQATSAATPSAGFSGVLRGAKAIDAPELLNVAKDEEALVFYVDNEEMTGASYFVVPPSTFRTATWSADGSSLAIASGEMLLGIHAEPAGV